MTGPGRSAGFSIFPHLALRASRPLFPPFLPAVSPLRAPKNRLAGIARKAVFARFGKGIRISFPSPGYHPPMRKKRFVAHTPLGPQHTRGPQQLPPQLFQPQPQLPPPQPQLFQPQPQFSRPQPQLFQPPQLQSFRPQPPQLQLFRQPQPSPPNTPPGPAAAQASSRIGNRPLIRSSLSRSRLFSSGSPLEKRRIGPRSRKAVSARLRSRLFHLIRYKGVGFVHIRCGLPGLLPVFRLNLSAFVL